MNQLPQMRGLFLTDGGIETDMIFNRGLELRCFAAIDLLRTAAGRQALEDYYGDYLRLAQEHGTGFILESPTWRASSDWADELELSPEQLDDRNREAIALMKRLRDEFPSVRTIVVSGCIGPRGDGYDPGRIMFAEEAREYHSRQAQVLSAAGADMLSAITMTNVPEAAGIALAARDLGHPVVISFTVETDGRLPTGDTLRAAIENVDAMTGAYPAYYMVNCAHPTHFKDVLAQAGRWTERLGGIRANASRCSHAELEAMRELDIGHPRELGALYAELRSLLPNLNVLGGCCGTDIRHLREIAANCASLEAAAA